MKKTNFENTLALAGALLVLIGVGAAANTALADENISTDSSIATAAVEDMNQVITESASEAAVQATDDAIVAMSLANQLDLDCVAVWLGSELLDRHIESR